MVAGRNGLMPWCIKFFTIQVGISKATTFLVENKLN
jgi:hypothetical protein